MTNSESSPFFEGQFVHYGVGSDVYGGRVTKVSPSGSTVTVQRVYIVFFGPQSAYPGQIKSERPIGEPETFRSRNGSAHKSQGRELQHGYRYELDPNF